MKKIFVSLILVILIFALFSCSDDKYEPAQSTEEESKVIYTLEIEDEKYEIRYELYRFLFLTNKGAIDGGNSDVWSGPDAKSYIDKMDAVIIGEAAEIFSVLHLANNIGFDPYSDKADYEVEQMFLNDINSCSGENEEERYTSFLKGIKQKYLNHSTADLLYRFALSEKAIDEYYRTKYDYTEDNVKEFYFSDGCARILQAYFQAGVKSYSEVQLYRNELMNSKNEMALAIKIIGSTAANETDLIDQGELSGIILGKRSLSQREYADYVNEIFSTPDETMTPVITLKNTNADGYYLVYRLAKTNDHFEKFYPAIANAYIDDIVGGTLGGMENALVESCTPEPGYDTIVHAEISMS